VPASSKAQQRFFGVVKSMQKGDKPKKGEAGKIAKQMSKKDVDKYASTKHKGKPEKVKREMKVRELIKKMVREELANLEEAAKRDYKAEYKKFQSSTKSKKYRAELNKYNRKKGTYGNGDGKDASHKGGKIVGFEKESVNRGRAEKSRLKKEGKLKEHTVKFTKDEMAKLHKDGKLEKADDEGKMHTYTFSEGKLKEGMDRKKAAIILKQIGGNRFIAMTGAKDFAFSNKYMSFKIGRNSKGINFVRIGHNAKDLYDMEFGFVSVRGIKVKKKVKDVYADMLGQIFKKHTGMNVRL
jgi:hypothetical protein